MEKLEKFEWITPDEKMCNLIANMAQEKINFDKYVEDVCRVPAERLGPARGPWEHVDYAGLFHLFKLLNKYTPF